MAVRSVTVVRVVLAALLLLWTTGCNIPYETRYGAVPGPITTAELVAAAVQEPVPLTAEEWSLVDAAMDRYLRDYAVAQAELIAPLVREARDDPTSRWPTDAEIAQRMARRAQSALARVRALDETLLGDLTQALPERAAFIERVRTRRAIDRAACVVLGDDRHRDKPGVIDVDVEAEALLHNMAEDPATAPEAARLRGALEPLRATYRTQLAAAARNLADALLDFPTERARILADTNLSEDVIGGYVRHGTRPETQQEMDVLYEAVRRAQGRITRAIMAIDDLTESTLDAWGAVLPAASMEQLRNNVTYRYVLAKWDAPIRWLLEIMEALPQVREGQAPKTTAALRALRQAADEYARASQRQWRAYAEATPADADAIRHLTGTVQVAARAMENAQQEALRTAEQELPREIVDSIHALGKATHADAEQTLRELVGRTRAARLMARAPQEMFAPSQEEESLNREGSFAIQMLLGPMASKPEFTQMATLFGADPLDPIMEELWQRYHERAAELERTQEETLRQQELEVQQAGYLAQEDLPAFERRIVEYTRAVMTADAQRGQLMEDTLMDMAAARGLDAQDVRVRAARVQLAAARCAVRWTMFRLPWLLGPLQLAQADTLALVARAAPTDPDSQAVLAAIAAEHVQALEQTTLEARRVGFDTLREFLIMVLRMQQEDVNGNLDPADLPNLPQAKTMARRVREAAIARAEAQIALMDAVAPVLGQERTARLRAAYAEEVFPAFFTEYPWRQEARALAEASSLPAAETWRAADARMIDRLLNWTRAPGVLVFSKPSELARGGQEDGELAALRVLRDEYAFRLLRDAAVAEGQPADARMSGAVRSVSRTMLRPQG